MKLLDMIKYQDAESEQVSVPLDIKAAEVLFDQFCGLMMYHNYTGEGLDFSDVTYTVDGVGVQVSMGLVKFYVEASENDNAIYVVDSRSKNDFDGGWYYLDKNSSEYHFQKIVWFLATEQRQQEFNEKMSVKVAQAPELPTSLLYTAIGRDAVLTFEVERTALTVRANDNAGRALVLEFDALWSDDNPKRSDIAEFLRCILNNETWVNGSAWLNAWDFPGRSYIVLTAPAAPEDDAPLVSIWWNKRSDAEDYTDFLTYLTQLKNYHEQLAAWSTATALELDITPQQALSALQHGDPR